MTSKLLISFALLYSATSFAAIYKCTEASGHVAYSDTACNDKPDRRAIELNPATESRTESSVFSQLSEKIKLFFKKLSDTRPAETQVESTESTSQFSNFQCDGRTYCSQMTSCEEATFFINNCPDTKMDGNHDGVPCEKQWCR